MTSCPLGRESCELQLFTESSFVTTAATTVQRPAHVSEGEANGPGLQPRRSNRPRAPNPRVAGDDWTTA